MRRGVGVGIVVVLVAALATPVAAAAAAPSTLQKGLLARLDAGDLDRFVVEFSARADLGLAAATPGWVRRGAAVRRTLVVTAGRSQAQARAVVDATPGASATSYWLTNVMVVDGGARLATRLASLPGVAAVRAERVFPLVEPVESHAVTVDAGDPPPWGITKIGAEQAWAEGVTGSGVVVANIDTGVDVTHEALVGAYRGILGGGGFDHDYNWWDPSGICGDEPCDNVGHGSHTMGTMVGGDGPGPFTPDIGVAPGARWIAAKGCESEFCSESALLSSGQWVLAPTDLDGDAPDPSKRPDIVNNSWGAGPGDAFYAEVVSAWRAAGIVPIFSSGNPGSACGDGGSPGDYAESFSVGATDVDDAIADFSGRGPSVFGKVNPDVTAPGVDVVSSVPGGGYESFSGTSMAAPHTAGTLALVLSAEPALIGNVDGATGAVRSTALDILDDACGGDADLDPNNVFGDGRIDAAAAVSLVATGGTLAGFVTDADTDDPVAGAAIEATRDGRTFRATSDLEGNFELFLGAGGYMVTVTAFGYQGAFATGVEIETDTTTTLDVVLVPLPRRDVTGIVTAEEDATPIEGAEVLAVGTPVAPARTAADGTYTLTLPVGTYEIRTAAGGCTDADVREVTLGLDGLTHDVALSRTLDASGHGCEPIPFEWIDATTEASLFGDQVVGRLSLPFAFPFYGETFQRVFVTDNGYLTFVAPEDPWLGATPATFPSKREPNAAIYALWQNLVIDDASGVEYATVGETPDRAFVIELRQLRVGPRFSSDGVTGVSASARVDLEVKLWESGQIDVLYGNNPANPGDGRHAAIGIEAPGGTDGLVFGMFEDLVTPGSAYRYRVVPSGMLHGTVTDANDGLPVAHAVVTASPGGRSATTAADGTYTLRLRPGTYALTFEGRDYETDEIEGVVVADQDDLTLDAVLEAAAAVVTPATIEEVVERGTQTTARIDVDNTGGADLAWRLFERDGSATPPDLPEVPAVTRSATWGAPDLPARVQAVRTHVLPPGALETIVDDPDDDSAGTVEITRVRGGSDETDMTMAIEFGPETPMDEVVGYVHLDTDQDPETGMPPEWFFGLPGHDIGFDYFADLFLIHEDEPVVLIWDVNFELVAEVPASLDGTTVTFSVPLVAFGPDEDGAIDTTMSLGTMGPEDWAPNEGHGTIRTFTDIPWLVPSASEGVVPAGDGSSIDLTLGAPALPPGTYAGEVVLQLGAPRTPAAVIDVHLQVTRPATWGAAAGTVRSAHGGAPIEGATVIVAASHGGVPLDLRDTTGADGAWSIQGPQGTWPARVKAPDHLTVSTSVTIRAGVTVGGQDASLHAAVPHARLNRGPIDLLVPKGRVVTIVRPLGNQEGHRPLEFSVGEAPMPVEPGPGGGGGGEPPPAEGRPLASGVNPQARTSRGAGGARAAAATAVGEVLASWPTEMTAPWGVGVRGGTVTIGDAEDLIDVEFATDGRRLGEYGVPWADAWAADMAWDAARGLMWQVNVGGDNGIYGIDPVDGSVVETITGDPWGDVSQRGLAFDPTTDTFYIGGWNEGIVYHVAGPSWPAPGTTLGSCAPKDPNISGLAYNAAFRKLWVTTNSETDAIWLIDAATCETEGGMSPPDGGGYQGAGVELDPVGNLWLTSQGSKTAYLIDSGLPSFSDVPWLSVAPAEGTVPVGGSVPLAIEVDTTALAPGVHRAVVAVVTNDPSMGVALIPVQVAVSRFQRAVNVGGRAMSFGDGTTYLADRPYAVGSFGYFGTTTVRTTPHAIAGTRYPGVYRSQREGITGYRFTVPNGTYLVRLGFAELTATPEFGRVMDISSQGRLVLNNLDVAGRVGRFRALDQRFVVSVNNQILNVRFDRAFGRPPILNAIEVTWLPEGYPVG